DGSTITVARSSLGGLTPNGPKPRQNKSGVRGRRLGGRIKPNLLFSLPATPAEEAESQQSRTENRHRGRFRNLVERLADRADRSHPKPSGDLDVLSNIQIFECAAERYIARLVRRVLKITPGRAAAYK